MTDGEKIGNNIGDRTANLGRVPGNHGEPRWKDYLSRLLQGKVERSHGLRNKLLPTIVPCWKVRRFSVMTACSFMTDRAFALREYPGFLCFRAGDGRHRKATTSSHIAVHWPSVEMRWLPNTVDLFLIKLRKGATHWINTNPPQWMNEWICARKLLLSQFHIFSLTVSRCVLHLQCYTTLALDDWNQYYYVLCLLHWC